MAFRSVPRPSSPPSAKASTECPYRAQYKNNVPTKNATWLSPCTGTIAPRLLRADSAPAAQQASYSALYPTPLNTDDHHHGTILGALQHHDPFRSDSHGDRHRPTHTAPLSENHRVV